ncbi:hypothetical protein [Mucilaginibacter sp. UR6-11]|uniref:hypothetical protein n=1 Tax=Mucilaginibacter sp. UR6-11 TaxID=1435644 RepID=UPI001E548B52|nr:hypothetical protein [Mucilaginibacter sp. UR6-11]MCC8423430.1 hypothetical protein [Mucilaginibacter sp. UR6-11]
MRRLIIITIILLIATIAITVVYFKNLNTPGLHNSQTMGTIPDNAALVFEFNNEDSFYDIFTGNKLFEAVIGKQNLADIDTLHHQLMAVPPLKKFFTGQNTFISLHPLPNHTIELLITIAATKGFNPADIDKLPGQLNKNLLVSATAFEGKKGYTIYSGALKKRFYLLNKEDGIYTGSFSKELIEQSARYIPQKDKKLFLMLPDQQNTNSLANLYVNYSRLDQLSEALFKNKNTDIFKSFKLLPALAALNLNFKSDALLFTGFSNIQQDQPSGYLNLFANQQPVVNSLKDIFPSTTAYSISFAVSDPKKFKADLSGWYVKAKLQHEKDSLFNKVKKETGINLISEFNQVLGNEFAVVTTRYMEKYAIISLTNGSAFKPVMQNISNMTSDNIGQVNYTKLPYFLLGDAFNPFYHPWFMIVDNYLILANTESELKSYYDSYFNRKFQSKTPQYNQFNDLMAEKCNVALYINFKNAQPILKTDLNNDFYSDFETNKTGWKNFYAASYQLIAADKNFYTSFCMGFNQNENPK